MSNSSQNNDTILRKLTRIHEVDRTTMVNAKLDILIKKLERMDMKAVDIAIRFKICRGGHASIECNILNAFSNEQNKEQANMTYFNQRRQRNLYSNTYNQGQRNHLNFLWKNQQAQANTSQNFRSSPPGFHTRVQPLQPLHPTQKKQKSSLELMMKSFIQVLNQKA